mmetsp:Transcript_14284/g.36989  ORF Transcript_14284/g.36989 Transcript_14284/m.36989 type:complete len:224 (+) Transcript_14284:289-960(+)
MQDAVAGCSGAGASWLAPWSWGTESAGIQQRLLDEDEWEDFEELEFLYVAENCTCKGMRVAVVVGKHLVMYPGLDPERLYRYVEWKLESVARDGPFVMLYVHSNASYTENCPGVLWLRSLYSRLPGVCRDNLRAFWVLHCNWALWFTMLSICPYLMASDFWGKVEYINRVEYLELRIRGALDLPPFVLEHDRLLEDQPLADYGLFATKEAMVQSGSVTGQVTL